MRRLTSWFLNRAWSRAGAVAVALASAAPRRALELTTRVLLLLVGSLAIALAVATMLWNSFGPGPLDVFITGLTSSTGLPFAMAYWVAFATMVVLTVALGRRPGLGTIAAPLLIGPAVQMLVSLLDGVGGPESFVGRTAVHLLAIGLAGIGAGALVVSGLGAGTGELLATAASDRTGRPEPHLRLGFELAWLAIGIALGGTVGVGTVLVALLIGPAVVNGHRLVCACADASRRTFPIDALIAHRELASSRR